MHSFVEEDYFKEVSNFELYNKFKYNSDDFSNFFLDFKIDVAELFYLEKIKSFEEFDNVYSSKISPVQLILQNFNYFFNESFFFFSCLQQEFYFNDVTRLGYLYNFYMLYYNSLVLYDSLSFLLSSDSFFLGLFDFCNSMQLQDFFIFFIKLGNFLFFLEHFLFNIFTFFSFPNFYKMPEFYQFFNDSFLFYNMEFFCIFENFIKFKSLLDKYIPLNFFCQDDLIPKSFSRSEFFFSDNFVNL